MLMGLTPALLLAQGGYNQERIERAYESFKITFDREFASSVSVEDSAIVQRQIITTTIPEWFIFPGRVSGYSQIIHGISDPGLDPAMAMHQAWLRALALAAIAWQCTVHTIMDNFHLAGVQSDMAGKFNVFTDITATRNLAPDSYELIAQHYTTGGEMIVLVGFKEIIVTDSSERVIAGIENFDSEHVVKNRPLIIGRKSVEITSINNQGRETTARWARDKSMNAVEITSFLDTSDIYPAQNQLIYRMPEDVALPSPSSEYPITFSLSHGLWNAYISAVLQHLEVKDNYGSQVKNMDERYDQNFQGLTRVIFSGGGSFRIKQAAIIENRLLLEFD